MLWFAEGRPSRRVHAALAVNDSAGLRHIRAVGIETIETPLEIEADEARGNPAALVAAMAGDLIAAGVDLPVVLQALSEPDEPGEDISARAYGDLLVINDRPYYASTFAVHSYRISVTVFEGAWLAALRPVADAHLALTDEP